MEHYVYDNLLAGAQCQSFRLLTLLPGQHDDPLRCIIRTDCLGENPNYEALSYCWGSKETTDMISCGKNAYLSLNQSLSSALRQLRWIEEPRVLWADAICINQFDTEEKSFQVNMMRDIYRQAHRVLVWLGEDRTGNTLRPLANLAKKLTEINNTSPQMDRVIKQKHIGFGDNHILMLSSLLKRPWFRRIWVIQEVAVARDVIIHCGNESM
jgi:hypothetical protein